MVDDTSYLPMMIYGEGELLDLSPRMMFVDAFSERLAGLIASAEKTFTRRVDERRVSPAIAKRWFAETQELLLSLKGRSQEENLWGEIGDLTVRLYTLSYVISEGILTSDIDIVDLLLSADELRVKMALQEQLGSLPVVAVDNSASAEEHSRSTRVPQ